MVKDLKLSTNKFNRYGGQVGSRTSGKNISTVWIVGQFDMGELGCGTSSSNISEVPNFQTIMMQDLRHGPTLMAL